MNILTDEDIELFDTQQSFNSGSAMTLTDEDIGKIDAQSQPKALTDEDIAKFDAQQINQQPAIIPPTGTRGFAPVRQTIPSEQKPTDIAGNKVTKDAIANIIADITAIPFRALGVRAPAEGKFFKDTPSAVEWLSQPVGTRKSATKWTEETGWQYEDVEIPRWVSMIETGVDIAGLTLVGKAGLEELLSTPQAQKLLSKIAFKPITAGTPGTATFIESTLPRKGFEWIAKRIAPQHPAFQPSRTMEDKIVEQLRLEPGNEELRKAAERLGIRIPPQEQTMPLKTGALPAPGQIAPLPEIPTGKIITPRKPAVYNLDTAVERGDYRTIIKASGMQLTDKIKKSLNPEDLKKIQTLFDPKGMAPDEKIKELKTTYPQLDITDDDGTDLIQKAIDQTGKKLKKAESQMSDKDWEKEEQAFIEREKQYEADKINQKDEVAGIEKDITGKTSIENLEEYQRLDARLANAKELLNRGFEGDYLDKMSDDVMQQIVEQKLTPEQVSILPSGELKVISKAIVPVRKFNEEIIASAKKNMKPGDNLETEIARTKDWISATLDNDEVSTNQELVDYFQKEGGFSKDIAEFIVSKRRQVRELPFGVVKEMQGSPFAVQPTMPPTGLRPGVPQSEIPPLTGLKEGLSPEQQLGGLLSKGTPGAMGTAEPVISETQKQEEFKLYTEVDKLIHKYAVRFGERYVPSGAVGALYKDTGNIFIRGANALFTTIHEVTHYIDLKEGISKAALRTTGVSKAGNPIYDPTTKLLRKEMTSFYTSNYPGGLKTHKLEKRMRESLARFVEMYVYKPTYIKENYPYLYKEILQTGGQFFNTTTIDLVRDARAIIGKYQALSPTQKILSRQMSKERKISDSYLSLPEKVYTEVADALFPIEKLAKGAELAMTVDDPSLWARFANNGISTVTANNIYGNNGYWIMDPDGDFIQKYPFNWKTIVDSVSGETDVFGAWLSARDTKFNFDRLDELIKAIEIGKANIDPTDLEARKALADAEKESIALKRQLDTNGVTRQEAEAAYAEHKARFAEAEQMFDALTQEDLNLLNHPLVQLLKSDLYMEFSERKGYAPKKRDFFFNEILGEQSEYVGNVKVGKTKVSSMLPRKGSELPELNPLYSSILNHAEVMKKAVRQMVYNRILNLAQSWPEVLQVIPLKTAVMPTGEVFFPQEKDPNIIMARLNYKRQPVLVAKEIKRVLDATVTYQNVHIIERWMKNVSRLFVKGTTATYPPFALTNFLVDQITAAAQTQTKIKPIISPLKELILRLDKHSQDATLFKEYLLLGGQRQTLVRYLDGSPDEVLRNIQQEKSGLEKALDLLNQGVDIFAIPTQYSEILTRAAEYIRARKAGNQQIVALEMAGQVTAPFHHKGRWGGSFGTSWVASLPFFNPGIQVIAQYSKAWGDPKTRNRAAFVTALVVGGMIASFEYLRAKGTPEQQDLYKGLTADELARYLFIPYPNGKNLLRLRLPEQMAVLGTLINMTLANLQMDTRYKPGEFINGALSWLPEQFDPTNPARLLFSWMPQIMQPALGFATGKKFYPTVRDIEGPSLKYLPEGQRAYSYTSALAKFIGEKLNLSPAKIDYLIEGYLGRATRMFIGKNIGNPFVRDMYLSSSRQLQDYYDLRENNAIKYKNIDQVKDMNKRRQIRRLHDKITDIDELISKFRKVELEKDQKDESYIATLRSKILDRVDTLWEVAR